MSTIAYEKDSDLPVTVDLLVSSLQCRQTDASWSYRYFREHSVIENIEGTEQSIEVRIPERELLIAVKLHSGRLTDARDAVALTEDVDLEKLEAHIDRGDRDELREILEKVDATITSDNFEDSFKGVFQQGTLPEDKIDELHQFIQEMTQ